MFCLFYVFRIPKEEVVFSIFLASNTLRKLTRQKGKVKSFASFPHSARKFYFSAHMNCKNLLKLRREEEGNLIHTLSAFQTRKVNEISHRK